MLYSRALSLCVYFAINVISLHFSDFYSHFITAIVIPIDTEYQHPSVAGPRQKRHKKRTSGANKTHDTQSMMSSTSVMLSHSGSEGETNSDGRREKGRRHVGGRGVRIRSSSNMIVCSTSESEQSDADSGPINIK